MLPNSCWHFCSSMFVSSSYALSSLFNVLVTTSLSNFWISSLYTRGVGWLWKGSWANKVVIWQWLWCIRPCISCITITVRYVAECTTIKSCNKFVGPWPPFIIGLPYDDLPPSAITPISTGAYKPVSTVPAPPPPHVASNRPIKTLVARQQPTTIFVMQIVCLAM